MPHRDDQAAVHLPNRRVRSAAIAAAAAGLMAAAAGYWHAHVPRAEVAVEEPSPVVPGMDVLRIHPACGVGREQEKVILHYTDVPLSASSESGLVMSYWSQDPDGKDPRQAWKLYRDGRVVHEVGPASHAVLELVSRPYGKGVGRLFSKADELEPREVIITRDLEDDTILSGFAFYGTGRRRGTEADAEATFEDMKRVIVEASQLGAR